MLDQPYLFNSFNKELENLTQPFSVSYGAGVDSTAMLVGLAQRGITPDLIQFANVGCEKKQTYEYFKVIAPWLDSVGFPPIKVCTYTPTRFVKGIGYTNLFEELMDLCNLPSLAYGGHTCSLKWKISPQEKFMKSWAPALRAWEAGMKVKRAIGYDASNRDQKRYAHSKTKHGDKDPLYENWCPLIEWGWDREECIKQIKNAGLPVPVKSSCYFCPAIKEWEVDELSQDRLLKIIMIECRAEDRLTNMKGLWRNGTKTKPGKITDYIKLNNLIETSLIEHTVKTFKHMKPEHGQSWKEIVETFLNENKGKK